MDGDIGRVAELAHVDDALIPVSSRYLLQIVLSNNALMDEIPPSIGNSTNLGVLDLSGNMLLGSIPSSIESLAKLRVLSLQRNRLSGQIPVESLGHCTKLIRLDLSSNRFTGSLGHVQLTDTGFSTSSWNPIHRQLNRQIVQWAVYLTVCKLFNVFI